MTLSKGADQDAAGADVIESGRALTPQAQRALAEARQRRDAEIEAAQAKEVHGRGGLEPVRFGDWEVKGLATDF